MITEKDITAAFAEVRNHLHKVHTQDNGRKEGKAKADADRLYNLFLIGLYVGESIVTDLKRIADRLDNEDTHVTFTTQPKG